MKVALIIGHNEKKQGAKNKAQGVTEFQFNEPLVFAVALELEKSGIEPVIIYRDCSYKELPGKVNLTRADIAVSFHCNAFNGGAHGTETLYYKGSEKGKILAQSMQDKIVACLQLPDRGIKAKQTSHKGKAGDRGGILLKRTLMPCVIAEPFFIDSDKSLLLAVEKLEDLAVAYAGGIINYLDET